MTGPLGISLIAEGSCAVADIQGLVECGAYVGVAEPGGEITNGGAVGVVEVVTRGEEFDGAGSAMVEGVEQARVQALPKKDVGRDTGLHHLLRYSSGVEGGAVNACQVFVRDGRGRWARIGALLKE